MLSTVSHSQIQPIKVSSSKSANPSFVPKTRQFDGLKYRYSALNFFRKTAWKFSSVTPATYFYTSKWAMSPSSHIFPFICATKLPSAAYSYAVQKEPLTINEHQTETSNKILQAWLLHSPPFLFCVFFWVLNYDFIEMCEFLPSGTKFISYFIPPRFSYLISEYFVYSCDVDL